LDSFRISKTIQHHQSAFLAGGTTALPYAHLLLSAVFPLMKNRFKESSDCFWYIRSFCRFISGALLATGAWF
jgi:hypothetical protein